MKLVFPHKEHKDFELIGDSFTIGSSDKAMITIKDKSMHDVHATLIKDGEDYALKIETPACMASVNGRLVKDSREVRVGDLMIISQVHCKIESGNAAKKDDNKTRIRMALPKYVLRGVSGVYFGKTFPLRGKTSLGRHSENDIFVNVDGISRKHALISVLADGLEIEDLDSSNGTFVNGKQITKQKLNIGDEVKLDNIRFLIQAPGAPMSDAAPTSQAKPAKTAPPAAQDSSSGNTAKWLITLLVLAAAAGAGAWYMGLFDKFLN